MTLTQFADLKREITAIVEQASLDLTPTVEGITVREYDSYSDLIHTEILADDDITLVGDEGVS